MYTLETGCVDRLCRMSHLRQHVCVEYVGCPVNYMRVDICHSCMYKLTTEWGVPFSNWWVGTSGQTRGFSVWVASTPKKGWSFLLSELSEWGICVSTYR